MEYAGLEILPERRELRVDGRTIALGGRAFDVVRVLVEAQGKLVSKDEILTRVWPNTLVEENSLQVTVSALRKALGVRRNAIHTVSGRGYQIVARLAAERSRPATNLPAPSCELIGREGVLDEITHLAENHRVVTLTGAGGMGKTRLAFEAARRLLPRFPDGVWVVELATTGDGAAVPHLVASAVGLEIPDNLAVPARIAALLADKKILLVLDNCEQVIDAAAELAFTLIRANPDLAILATSREPLRTAGEGLYRVLPLDVPAESVTDPAALLAFGSVQLFAARARSMDPGFPLDEACLMMIAAICRRLDGIPLAIEIAAARATTLGVDELSRRLDDQFRVLTGGFRTALARHRTLRATFDWSYDLLTDAERYGLCRLAMFVGRFTLGMADAILSAAGGGTRTALDLVPALVAKSLIVTELTEGNAQYRLLETMRAYALDRLREDGRYDEVASWHATYCLRLLECAELDWQGCAKSDRLGEMCNPVGNVRAALGWALTSGNNPALGMALTAAAAPFWMHLSMVQESRFYVGQAMELLGADADPRLEMRLVTAQGAALLTTMAHGPEVRQAFTRALALADRLGDADYRLRAYWGLCSACFNDGDFVGGRESAQRFHELATASADPSAIMSGDLLLGGVMFVIGELDTSRTLIERVLHCTDVPPDQPSSSRFVFNRRAMALGLLGSILWHQGHVDQSRQRLQESVEEALSNNHVVTLCNTLANWVCLLALFRGELDEADRFVAMLLDHSSRYHLDFWVVWAECFQAVLAVRRDEKDSLARLRSTLTRSLVPIAQPRFAALRIHLVESLGAAGEREEARAIVDQMTAMVERQGQWWVLPELWRVKSEILARRADAPAGREAGALLRQALQRAQQQGFLSQQLRIATSQVRLIGASAKPELAAILAKFTEGLDTADLVAARAALAA